MINKNITNNNREYWNENADSWFGVTSLPKYGVKFVTEDELKLFGDVSGKTMLEICCGSGHSIKYHADKGAKELWGLDISSSQIRNAKNYLRKYSYFPKLICGEMENDLKIPNEYFDCVYSIYGIGWATDLDLVFKRVHSYLKTNGVFIFSWKHPLHGCTEIENGNLLFNKSYFDESFSKSKLDNMDIILSNRKISSYINALVNAGFMIEKMIEETDDETVSLSGLIDEKSMKAKIIPLSFIFKVKKYKITAVLLIKNPCCYV